MSCSRIAFFCWFIGVSYLVSSSSAGPVPVPSEAYVKAVPYNVPPHAASVNVVQNGLSSPYSALPYYAALAAPYYQSYPARYFASQQTAPYLNAPAASYLATAGSPSGPVTFTQFSVPQTAVAGSSYSDIEPL